MNLKARKVIDIILLVFNCFGAAINVFVRNWWVLIINLIAIIFIGYDLYQEI